MNYLAHIYLSGNNPEVMVGGLLGDFVKGPLQGNLPDLIESGISLHRKIDVFTDKQPEVVTAIERFHSPFRRFAGIYLDICYDHFLAKHWSSFHHQEFVDFCQQFYVSLSKHYEILPPNAQHFCNVAPSTQWLESYANFNNLQHMLMRIGERFKKTVPLEDGFHLLQRDYEQLENEFNPLFTRLIEFANTERKLHY